tara:strand:- start:11037 stop:11255 length:219 start_codon:yes stop_codon:yes gene_type:complete
MNEKDLRHMISQIATIQTKLNDIKRNVSHLNKDVNNLNATANRWKGAFGVILIFGALLGWIGTIILKYIKGA